MRSERVPLEVLQCALFSEALKRCAKLSPRPPVWVAYPNWVRYTPQR
jgi:hypothetical protein